MAISLAFGVIMVHALWVSATRTISSQRYLDDEIVEQKRAAGDYTAYRARLTAYGEELYVVVDGHHSIAAAQADGIEIDWQDVDPQYQAEVNACDPDEWLMAHQHDSDWYDIETGHNVW